MELINTVDTDDNVIGTISRYEAYERECIVRWTTVFIITSDRRLVIQQRKRTKCYKPLRFDASVGGCVSAGESYDEAARREMKEELGLDIPLTYLGKYAASENGRIGAFSSLHIGFSDGPFSNWEEEAELLEFFNLDELAALTVRFPYIFTHGILCSIPMLKTFFAENNLKTDS